MPASPKAVCVTIGNFDGAHLGHQSLIALAKQSALEAGLDFALVTFWPHPRLALKGPGFHTPLSSREERLRKLKRLGANRIVEMSFTPELSRLSAEEFVTGCLLPLGMKKLVVGYDFRLGHEREGHFEKLAELAKKYGFEVTQAPPFLIDGAPASSTRLRRAIADGNVETAARMLGEYYSLGGIVGRGFGRGESLGFPTANLTRPDALVPGNGVYATFAGLGGKKYRAVTNIGSNPTFGNRERSIESFLLDAAGDFYDMPIRLEFVKRLRGELKFASAGELAAQIARDVEAARAIFQQEA